MDSGLSCKYPGHPGRSAVDFLAVLTALCHLGWKVSQGRRVHPFQLKSPTLSLPLMPREGFSGLMSCEWHAWGEGGEGVLAIWSMWRALGCFRLGVVAVSCKLLESQDVFWPSLIPGANLADPTKFAPAKRAGDVKVGKVLPSSWGWACY